MMKNIFVIFSLLAACGAAAAQGIVFEEGSLADASAKARSLDRLIFIDAYTSWCGPCKMMSAEVFPQEEAGEFFNSHFVNFKADAEKSEDGRHIARTYNVTAYPTFLFIDGEGELVYRFLGAKSLSELIEEGGKAVAAWETSPLLKEYEKRYAAGERGMDFLDGYAEVMSKSGLDASLALIGYLAQVDDGSLLSAQNLPRIQAITRYDPALAHRLVDALELSHTASEKDEKALPRANSAVGKYFSGTIRHIAINGTEEQFDELLRFKERFMALGNRNSVSLAMLGGGSFYLPAEMLRLDYYNNKDYGERFNEVFESYMTGVRESFGQIEAAIRQLEENAQSQIDEALAKGDERAAKSVRSSMGMMKTLAGMDNIYISTTLLEYIEAYDRYHTGIKDEAYRDKLAEWYTYLSGVSPSVRKASYAADKLIELGRAGDAVSVLERGLENAANDKEASAEEIEAARQKLAILKNDSPT